MMTLLHRAVMAGVFPSLLIAGMAFVQAPSCWAQTKPQPLTQASAPGLRPPSHGSVSDGEIAGNVSAAPPAVDPDIPPAVQKQLQIMKARIEQLELQLKHNAAAGQPSALAESLEKANEAPPATA